MLSILYHIRMIESRKNDTTQYHIYSELARNDYLGEN